MTSPLPRISAREAQERASQGALLIDVRSATELQLLSLAKAVHKPLDQILANPQGILAEVRHQDWILVCASGNRAQQAGEVLQPHCNGQLAILEGGIQAWRDNGLAVQENSSLFRYQRQMILPEFQASGQQKLLSARVLVIGAGGLGSPAAQYLAAAGVGNITIMDDDTVDISNLHRQILHTTAGEGAAKATSAQNALARLNPDIAVSAIQQRLQPDNADALFAAHDFVIDGSDNMETRYLVNCTAVAHQKPWVYGAVFQFEGQLALFDPMQRQSPCYACLYPDVSREEPASCTQAGVLGVVPGLIGIGQATECLKYLLGMDCSLGRLHLYDARQFSVRHITFRQDPDCPICNGV